MKSTTLILAGTALGAVIGYFVGAGPRGVGIGAVIGGIAGPAYAAMGAVIGLLCGVVAAMLWSAAQEASRPDAPPRARGDEP
ncbi:UNVERIFIED_ORG: putative membrane protein [Variovorax paradoxus]|nr:putative membrane protein [Variovorax paradoxus]